MLTDTEIRNALRTAPTSGTKTITLTDGGERGGGRLMLLIKAKNGKVTAAWYAASHRGGTRSLAKIAPFSSLSLADARKEFRARFAGAIGTGQAIVGAHARKRADALASRATVEKLFAAYVESLRLAGKRSAEQAESVLLTGKYAAVKTFGVDRPASAIETKDAVKWLAGTHARGAAVMAVQCRTYGSAAFGYALASLHNYTRADRGIDYGVKVNPFAAIPADASAHRVGNRWLPPNEFRAAWQWLVEEDVRSGPPGHLVSANFEHSEVNPP